MSRDGTYGRAQPRQRYRCTAPDGGFHRFTPPLPRERSVDGVCDVCDSAVHAHAGPVFSGGYRHRLRLVAEALVAVAPCGYPGALSGAAGGARAAAPGSAAQPRCARRQRRPTAVTPVNVESLVLSSSTPGSRPATSRRCASSRRTRGRRSGRREGRAPSFRHRPGAQPRSGHPHRARQPPRASHAPDPARPRTQQSVRTHRRAATWPKQQAA